MKIELRTIQPEDNKAVAETIKACLEEFDAAKEGTMYTDPSLYHLSDWFSAANANYWVAIDENKKVLGGSGIAPIPGELKDVAELQRMFLLPEARGTGTAKKLMQECLDFAKKEGFKQVYLETLPNMIAAQKLYQSFGFKLIDEAMGNTGHHACDVKMLLSF